MDGVVQSGGTATLHIDATAGGAIIMPLSGVQVTLHSSGNGQTAIVGQATSDSNGHFVINSSTTSSDGIFYATADLGDGVVLMTIIGPMLVDSITINELTTVAGAYCAAQFLEGGQIVGDSFGLRIVAGMNTNLVAIASGESSPVMTASPNADQTNAWRATLTLANLLASCVRDHAAARDTLFELATPPGGTAPTDTITAMGNIARFPANDAGGIYAQSKTQQIDQPALKEQPVAWTIAVKVNDSGDDAHMFGGPANLVFDAQGRAWIANNVVQGTGISTEWGIVLGPEGRPAVGSDGKRISPYTGGGLLGAGFGIDLDSHGRVWIGDFGWGKDNPTGSVSLFDENARPLSPPDGLQGGVYRVQGTVVDQDDNVWLASWGNGCVVVYPCGDARSAVVYQGDPDTFAPFGIAIAADGTAWVTNSNSTASGIVHLAFSGTQLQYLGGTQIGKTNKGIVIDSQGTIWVGSGGDDHVYAFTSDGTLIGGYQGGGIDGPWGITVDGDDNVWVANFGPLELGTVFHGRLTQLAGANDATRPANRLVGDGLSPQSGYTLPTAGNQVLLHDGTPLYGPDGPPCHIPMTRTTSANIDAAGNVWTCNNWKPSFDMDAIGDPSKGIAANPGGDGIVIFVGLAKPKG